MKEIKKSNVRMEDILAAKACGVLHEHYANDLTAWLSGEKIKPVRLAYGLRALNVYVQCTKHGVMEAPIEEILSTRLVTILTGEGFRTLRDLMNEAGEHPFMRYILYRFSGLGKKSYREIENLLRIF